MRRTWILLVRELRSLFLSPIAFAMLFLVWLLAGLMFSGGVASSVGDIHRLVADAAGMAMGLQLFLVPLLTMRQLSEERRIGTFEMLVTTPVRDIEIVLAKWISVCLFLALSWLFIPIYAVIIMIAGGEPDFGPVFASYFVVLTSGAVLAAVGLLASALTRQQIVAGFLGLALILAIFYLPALAHSVPYDWEAVRSVLAVADLSGHVREAGEGILDLVTLSYRLSLTGFLLLLTVRILEVRKWA